MIPYSHEDQRQICYIVDDEDCTVHSIAVCNQVYALLQEIMLLEFPRLSTVIGCFRALCPDSISALDFAWPNSDVPFDFAAVQMVQMIAKSTLILF